MQAPNDILYIWDSVIKKKKHTKKKMKHVYLKDPQINLHTHHNADAQWHCLHLPLMGNLRSHHRLL